MSFGTDHENRGRRRDGNKEMIHCTVLLWGLWSRVSVQLFQATSPSGRVSVRLLLTQRIHRPINITQVPLRLFPKFRFLFITVGQNKLVLQWVAPQTIRSSFCARNL